MSVKILDCGDDLLDAITRLCTSATFYDVEFYTSNSYQQQFEESDVDTSDDDEGELDNCRILFRAHRVILASQSSVFSKQLFGGFSESKEARVFVDPTLVPTTSIFKQFMQYFYTGKLVLTEKTVVPIMKLAHFYDVSILRKECEIYLAENITIESVSALIMESVNLEKDVLYRRCMEVIQTNFESVVQTSGFINHISVDVLEMILMDDQLLVSEISLFLHLVRWLKAKRSSQEDILRILHHVRFALMSPEDLVNQVLPTRMVPREWLFSALSWPIAEDFVRTQYLDLPFTNRQRRNKVLIPPLGWSTSMIGEDIDQTGCSLICHRGRFNIALGDQMVIEGRTKWSIKILSVPSHSHWELGIGFAKATVGLYHYLSAGEDGWGFFTTAGLRRSYIAHNNASCSNTYGVDFHEGDIVTVEFSPNGEVTFSINNISQGVAFTHVPLDVYPAVHLRNGAAVELLSDTNY